MELIGFLLWLLFQPYFHVEIQPIYGLHPGLL